MTKCIFVTATGTDIGKTYISALIVKELRKRGFNCGYYKPVLSGALEVQGDLIPGDCKYVIDTANLKITPTECLTYCFKEAVSPHLAAERQGIIISKEKILHDFEKLKQQYDYLLIEGAGGITCPLNMNKNYLLSNLIKDMNVSILIVADGGLGTINSILLTYEYAKQQNIKVNGIILNNYKEHFMYEDNKKVVEELTGIKVIATVKQNSTNIDITESVFE
ncbi:MAG: dethiobiotin synthase [Candidatus Gastranaerophilaceae bacterium]